MRKKLVFNISFTSIMIAFAICIEYLFKFVLVLDMPNGGSLTLNMLPLVMITIICGYKYGISGGMIFGLVNCFLIDHYFTNILSLLFDYDLAFASLSIIGIFREKILKGKKLYFVIGFILAGTLRWICAGISGMVNAEVFGILPIVEQLFGSDGFLYVFLYSFFYYNFPYVFASVILCVIVGLLIYNPVIMGKAVRRN